MPIVFSCPCGRKLQAQDEHAGRPVKCPVCGQESIIPAGEEAVRPAPAARPGADAVTADARREEPPQSDEDRPRRRSRSPDDGDEDDRPGRRSRRREEDDYDRRREPERLSGKAVAALVLGLLSLALNVLAGVPAIILGALSLNEIKRSHGRLGGKGLAIAGVSLGCLSCFALLPLLLLIPAVHAVRGAAARMENDNNMRLIGVGIISAAEDDPQMQMLPVAIYDKDGKALLSWRVAILPYIDQDALYKQFKLDEPWDGPNNRRLFRQMPMVYRHPNDPDAAEQGMTYYRVFTGPTTPFPNPLGPFPPGTSSLRYPADFTDGTSNTILVAEAGIPVVWTKPDELPYEPTGRLPKLGGHRKDGFVVLLADGTTHVIGPQVSERTLRAAITPNGNDLLGPDW
jgi:hypothetical protein